MSTLISSARKAKKVFGIRNDPLSPHPTFEKRLTLDRYGFTAPCDAIGHKVVYGIVWDSIDRRSIKIDVCIYIYI